MIKKDLEAKKQAEREYQKVYNPKYRKENKEKIRKYQKEYYRKKTEQRTLEVKRLSDEGYHIEQIADKMNISLRSVIFHLENK